MKANKRWPTLVLGAALTAGLISGVAVAGNPHGTPPGQGGTPPGQAKQQSSSSSTTATTSDNSTGAKPSSTTAHGAHNTHAAAGSNQTKLYGNGKTAGQIAEQNGAGPDTDLYGPGNSQPHKALVCSKNGKSHYVDVHALKSHRASSCESSSGTTSTSTKSTSSTEAATTLSPAIRLNSPVTSTAGTTVGTTAGTTAGTSASTQSGVAGASHTTRGGVLGASHTARSRPVKGTAGAAHAVPGAATFTG